MKVRAGITIDAPPAAVWDAIEAIERHVDWMADAVSIRFTGSVRWSPGPAARPRSIRPMTIQAQAGEAETACPGGGETPRGRSRAGGRSRIDEDGAA